MDDTYEDGHEDFDDDDGHEGQGRAGYSTLGQMAEQVQAKARADMKAVTGVEAFVDDEEYDDEDAEGVCLNGEEHTGRWTKDEHNMFLDGLKKFGKVRAFLCFTD